MKRTIFSILFIAVCHIMANAQYTIEYEYDALGNRTHRKIITLPSPVPTPDTQTPPAVDQLGERKIEVFPNPTKGRLLVRISGGEIDDVYFFNLYSSTGQLIIESKRQGQGDQPIEMEHYTKGIYILTLKTGKENLSYKIIKE